MMLSMPADGAQRASDFTALLLTAAAACFILIARPFDWRQTQTAMAAADQPVQISLESQPEAAPTPPSPTPHPLPKRHETVAHTAQTPAPPDPIPIANDPIPEEAAVVAADAPTPRESSPPAAANADLEAQYAQALREDIDRRTRLPDSPQYRLHRVSGEVRVRFIVSRSGEAREVQVAHSSGSTILDQAALSIVAAGHYAPMPAAIFVNQAEHLFAVTIAFNAAVQAARAQ
jgi:protein TonB